MTRITGTLHHATLVIHKPPFPVGHRNKTTFPVVEVQLILHVCRTHLSTRILTLKQTLNVGFFIDVIVFPKNFGWNTIFIDGDKTQFLDFQGIVHSEFLIQEHFYKACSIHV